MKQRVTMKNLQRIDKHHDDEKGGDETADTVKLRDTIRTLRVMNESLQNEVERLETENVALKKRENESMIEVVALKKTNMEIREQMRRENKRMRVKIEGFEEEQKEFMMKIAELEDKVKELEMKALDPFKFMEWDCNQIHLWIMGLEGGRFQKYDAVLKDTLTRDEVMGEDLSDVTPLVLRGWGIRDRKDSKALNQYIEQLVARNQSNHGLSAIAAPKQNEGAPTAYI